MNINGAFNATIEVRRGGDYDQKALYLPCVTGYSWVIREDGYCHALTLEKD